jgi:hypothetical protein
MTKENLTDLLKDALANGDCPQELKGKYHPEILAKQLALAMDYLVAKVLYPEAKKNNNWGALDVYVKAYKDVAILYDEGRDEYYCIMPLQPINLPSNRGVRSVSPMKEQNYKFIYRDNNTSNTYGKLEVNSAIPTARYYVEGIRLYFSEHLNPFLTTLLLKLLVPFDKLDDEDDVNIPQGFGKLAFDLVYQQMSGKKFEKVSNDNNANTV